MGDPGTQRTESASDTRRASLKQRDLFEPFRVERYEHLRDALASGGVRNETPMLLTELPPQPLALVTTQMTYHHVAQGEIAGHRWMVSF